MLFKGNWDSNNTSYPYIGQFEGNFYVGWVYADANGGAAEAPLWLSKNDGYAITGNYDGEKEFAYALFSTVEEAKASLPEEKWQATNMN
jgi:hypothetical protein